MQSISLIGGTKSELTLNRWAGSYKDTPVYKPEIEATGVKGTLFEGTAAEAIKLLPKMINIGVSTSLATVGPENTYIKITGEPNIPPVSYTHLGENHRRYPAVKQLIS